MVGPKRTETQIEKDREEVARRYLAGETQAAIAHALDLSQQQISYDLKALRAQWLQSSLMAFDQRVAIELAKIDRLEAEYWRGYERSLQMDRKARLARSDGKRSLTLERAKRDGNPQFLQGVMSCIDRRVRLLGLDKPVKVDVEGLLREEAKRAGLTEEEAVAAAEAIVREMAAGQ